MTQVPRANYAFMAAATPVLYAMKDNTAGWRVSLELLDRITDVVSSLGDEPPDAEAGAPVVRRTEHDPARTLAEITAVLALRSALPDLNAHDTEALDEFVLSLHDFSMKLGSALRKSQAHRVRGLYVIIDPQVTGGRDPLAVAEAALQGGAKMLQLRDKLRDKGQSLPLAEALQRLCEAHDALLIINDHLDLAAAVGSGGAHVGQTDMPISQARRVLSPRQVLGRSNREFSQIIESQQLGADHVAFGPIYQTDTKAIVRDPQGPERLRRARDVATVPLVAIGGINADNVGPVVQAGADAVCVTAAVGAAPDPEAAANRLVEAIRQAGGKV
jgi:thiamine-phosphate diphosphorylase